MNNEHSTNDIPEEQLNNMDFGTNEEVSKPSYFSSQEPIKDLGDLSEKRLTINVPGVTEYEKAAEIKRLTESIDKGEFEGSREEWLRETTNRIFNSNKDYILTPNGLFQKVNVDDYDNITTYAGDDLINKRATYKKTNDLNTNSALFLSYARNMAGMGTNVSIPLWNSGIWITMSVPKEVDILYVLERLSSDAIHIGIDTGKFIGTMHDCVFYNTIVDFIISHYIRSNVKLEKKEDIVKYILISDIQALINGIINAMYPDGYTVTRSCKFNFVVQNDGKAKCNFRTSGLVKPSNMIYKNNKLISEDMIVHMAKRRDNAVSVEEVLHYQKDLNVANKDFIVTAKDNVYGLTYNITLSIPSVADYQTIVNIWSGDMESSLSKFLDDGDSLTKKREKASKILRSNYLSSFLSYVKDIEQVSDETGDSISTTIVKNDKYVTIKGFLEDMSPKENIIDAIETGIRDYISNSTVAVVGLPNYVCPTCQALQQEKMNRDFDNIIPLDMMKLFFILSQIRTRDYTS